MCSACRNSSRSPDASTGGGPARCAHHVPIAENVLCREKTPRRKTLSIADALLVLRRAKANPTRNCSVERTPGPQRRAGRVPRLPRCLAVLWSARATLDPSLVGARFCGQKRISHLAKQKRSVCSQIRSGPNLCRCCLRRACPQSRERERKLWRKEVRGGKRREEARLRRGKMNQYFTLLSGLDSSVCVYALWVLRPLESLQRCRRAAMLPRVLRAHVFVAFILLLIGPVVATPSSQKDAGSLRALLGVRQKRAPRPPPPRRQSPPPPSPPPPGALFSVMFFFPPTPQPPPTFV